MAKHGLFELTDGMYQVRGADLSNMSLVETDTGVIVIDPLMSDETAAASGFLEHAVSENVYAGPAMSTISLLVPTVDVTHTGQEAVIDGVRVTFQVTPGTEAPAEMNFFFPDQRALCMAENATHTVGPGGNSTTSGPVWPRSMKFRMYGVVAFAVISPSRSR